MNQRLSDQLSPSELLNRDQKLLEALCIDYTAVYYCNLDANTMEPIKRNALSNGLVIDAAIPDHCYEYSYRIRYFYDNFVVKESAPNLLKKLSASYLKKHLQSKERLHREIQKLIAVISTQDIKRREISGMQSTPGIFI